MRHDATRTSPRRGLIVYSSRTGNTEKIARAVHEALTAEGEYSDATPIIVDIACATDAPNPNGYGWIILAFWVNRGHADDDTLAYLEKLEGKPIGFIATLGAYPDSEHAATVTERFAGLVSTRNRLLGSFLCQGRIDPRLTEKFKSFPPDHPHAMTPERAKRHRDAASHPDDRDIANAIQACRTMLSRVEVG